MRAGRLRGCSFGNRFVPPDEVGGASSDTGGSCARGVCALEGSWSTAPTADFVGRHTGALEGGVVNRTHRRLRRAAHRRAGGVVVNRTHRRLRRAAHRRAGGSSKGHHLSTGASNRAPLGPDNVRMHQPPVAYLFTFRTYATWLPGAEQGFRDKHHCAPGSAYADGDAHLAGQAARALRAPPLYFDSTMRACIMESVFSICAARGWIPHAVAVMNEHVHIVIALHDPPRRALSYLKARLTWHLRQRGLLAPDRPVWSRSNSIRWLFTEAAARAAVSYVESHRDSRRASAVCISVPPDEVGGGCG
jgi:hypothetical protein